MLDHAICINSKASLAIHAFFQVREYVHLGGVPPQEERFVSLCSAFHKVKSLGIDFFIDGFHPLFSQWPRVFDPSISEAVHDTAWTKTLLELGIFGIIWILRLFFSIQVVEIPKEFIETVCGRQHFVAVTKMVFTKLTSHVPLGTQQGSDGWIFFFHPFGCTRQTDFGKAGADGRLAGDECRTACRATLLAIPVGKQRALSGNPVDIGRFVAHHAQIICANIKLTDIIAPDHNNIGFLTLCRNRCTHVLVVLGQCRVTITSLRHHFSMP